MRPLLPTAGGSLWRSRTASVLHQRTACFHSRLHPYWHHTVADIFHALYNLKPLCQGNIPYVFDDTEKNQKYVFQICGNTQPIDCTPPYEVKYQRGVAIQFFGNEPAGNATCVNNEGNPVHCTRDCEVLGVGLPVINLTDPSDPFGGVNVTFTGVPSMPTDPFQCPFNNIVRRHTMHTLIHTYRTHILRTFKALAPHSPALMARICTACASLGGLICCNRP